MKAVRSNACGISNWKARPTGTFHFLGIFLLWAFRNLPEDEGLMVIW